jgi:SsrA-binding protein
MIENRKAKFDYEFLFTETAGIVLQSSEIKQLKDGKASLVDGYCYFDGNELYVKNFNINEVKTAYSHDPKRDKKLLLNKSELRKFKRELDANLTIIPLKVFRNDNGLFKMVIAMCKGKKNYNKKEAIKERDIKRDLERNY